MEFEVLKGNYLLFITPPIVLINGIPAFSYRLSDEEKSLIAEEILNASRDYLDNLYIKTLDALKRVQGELEVIGTLKVTRGTAGIYVENSKCYLISDGTFKTPHGQVKAFSADELHRKLIGR